MPCFVKRKLLSKLIQERPHGDLLLTFAKSALGTAMKAKPIVEGFQRGISNLNELPALLYSRAAQTALDAVLAAVALYAAFLLRFDGTIDAFDLRVFVLWV